MANRREHNIRFLLNEENKKGVPAPMPKKNCSS